MSISRRSTKLGNRVVPVNKMHGIVRRDSVHEQLATEKRLDAYDTFGVVAALMGGFSSYIKYYETITVFQFIFTVIQVHFLPITRRRRRCNIKNAVC